VPAERRGCYPRAACTADYAATFCAELTCLPQGFAGECSSALSELHGHGFMPNTQRGDDYASDRDYYGLSTYVRLFEFFGREVGEPVTDSTTAASHYGYFGQWMAPYARTNWIDANAASDANYRGSTATASIEGGLFTATKLGRTKYPKYLAGSSTHAYTPWSDTSKGWGFFERAVECPYLGLVYLSNRLIIPPSGIAYEPSQDTHADDGGIFVGSAWLALPIFHASSPRGPQTVQRNAEDPKVSWTHVIDTAQVRGPVLSYAPEFFTRRWVEWCAFRDTQDSTYNWQLNASTMSGRCIDPSVYQTLGYSPADWMPSTGGEFNSIPNIFHDSSASTEDLGGWTGPTFWKLPQFGYPSAAAQEPYLLDMRTYNSSVYNNMVDMFKVGSPVAEADWPNASAAVFSSGSVHMRADPSGVQFRVRYTTGGGQTDISIDAPMTTSREYYNPGNGTSGSDRDPIETNLFYDWTANRTWSRYAKTVDRQGTLHLASISEAEAPASLRPLEYTEAVRGRANYEPHERFASTTTPMFDATCFACTDAARCEQQVRNVTVESGAVVSYRWFRWRDQPALVALAQEFPSTYTDAYLTHMQTRIEWMHQHWDGAASRTDNFLKRPSKLKHTAELERVLVIAQPPAGVPAFGWVPVSLSEEYPATAEGRRNGGATPGHRHEGGLW